MDQTKENGTNFVPKPIGTATKDTAPTGTAKTHMRDWQTQNRLANFVRTILGLSLNENAILDAVRSYQMPKTAAKIAKTAGINRKMTNRILKEFEAREVVLLFRESGKRDRWRYNKKISRL